ncbi:hypothetical protein [Kitasatospora sp. NPDC059327]|uniref:hypothetical protein n=1 Tax=Kitasatospora sp. NPDC059327 TaxID=3346803 RepID=UPI0036CCEC2E
MGPLPASIYWRRRLVVAVAVAAVVALLVWLMSDQGGGGDGPAGKAAQAAPSQSSQPPAQAITPGASPNGPANNSRPGSGGTGGTNPGGGAVSGSGGGDVSLSTGGTGGGPNPAPATGGSATGGSAAGGSATGGSAAGGGGAAGGTNGGGGGTPPVNTPEVMALPVCVSSQVTLELAGAQNSYQPKDKPKLTLTVHNSSGANCRVDLGRTASAITVTASNGDRVWSSGDCPSDRGSSWAQIPANGGLTETFTWDRGRSKPQCATADPAAAPAGTYLVVADLTGLSGGQVSARSSIRLES